MGMIDCLILGDSIGRGIADVRPDCTAYVQSGINSRDWNKKYLDRDLNAPLVVISLGSNDLAVIRTEEELERLRSHIAPSNRVLWVLPAIKPRIQEIVFRVADRWRDDVIELAEVSRDGVHPTGNGYRALGKLIK